MIQLTIYYNRVPSPTVCTISEQDLSLVSKFRWSLATSPLAVRSRILVEGRQKTLYLHQLVALLMKKESQREVLELMTSWPRLQLERSRLGKIYHLDRNKLNCCRDNLLWRGLPEEETIPQPESQLEPLPEQEILSPKPGSWSGILDLDQQEPERKKL